MKRSKIALLFLCTCMILTGLGACKADAVPEPPTPSSETTSETVNANPEFSSSAKIASNADSKKVVLENRKLNVSILQMPIYPTSSESLEYLRTTIDKLMEATVRPELVVGVEYGLGFTPHSIDSEFIDYLGAIAKKHNIYFIPGTFTEITEDGSLYDTCPIFGPDGTLIDSYRKRAPYYPSETDTTPGESNNYCTFHIPEKDITVGVIICYDQFFPEISRTLAMEGAELIICPAFDPNEYDHIPDIIPRARALENELFFIWTNGVGEPCGNSTIVDPKGMVVYKCGKEETTYTATLDFAEVIEKRFYGVDQHLNSLRYFDLESPYANRVTEAPVYKDWPSLTMDSDEFDTRVNQIGMSTMPRVTDETMQAEQDTIMDQKMSALEGK